MSKYTIYLRRNKVNGKVYIGETKNFKQREQNWKCLTGPYANKHIDADRAEFGLENFTVEVLAEANSKSEALDLEERFIADYNSIWPNGYNFSIRGQGLKGISIKGEKNHNFGKHLSEETKQKISEAMKGKPSPFKGRHLSEKHKKKLSEALKGRIILDKTKQKISDANKGKLLNRCDKSKSVYQYTLDGVLKKVWPSIAECERNGFCRNSVSKCCRGKHKSHKGYLWSYSPIP